MMKTIRNAILALVVALAGSSTQTEAVTTGSERDLTLELMSVLGLDGIMKGMAQDFSSHAVGIYREVRPDPDPEAERQIRETVETYFLAQEPAFRQLLGDLVSDVFFEAELIELLDYLQSDAGMRADRWIKGIILDLSIQLPPNYRLESPPNENLNLSDAERDVLLSALGFERRILAAGELYAEEAVDAERRKHPDLDAYTADQIREEFTGTLRRVMPWLKAQAGPRLDEMFTSEERQAIVDFGSTGASDKYVEWERRLLWRLTDWQNRIEESEGLAEMDDAVTAIVYSRVR